MKTLMENLYQWKGSKLKLYNKQCVKMNKSSKDGVTADCTQLRELS